MDVSNLNLNSELLNNSEQSESENENIQHVIIDKSI
jgi:hypothetical protein